ncbi:hypothetical protein RB597_001595 [Gaeumannomyces tritici]
MVEPVADAKGVRPWAEADLAHFLKSGSDFAIVRRLPCHVKPQELGQVLPLADLENTLGPERILVLDSSFNPPTKAHRQMAIEAVAHYGSHGTRLLLLLSVNNADKAAKSAAFPARWAMMELLARDLALYFWEQQEQADRQRAAGWPKHELSPWFGIDMALTTLPYFHQKSEALAAAESHTFVPRWPNTDRRAQQVLLVGFDTLTRILDPRYYPPGRVAETLGPMFERATLRVTLRAGASAIDGWEQRRYVSAVRTGRDCKWTQWTWREKVVVAEETHRALGAETDISSTRARTAVAQQNWALLATLVPPKIAQWIQEQELYREESQGSSTEGGQALHHPEGPTSQAEETRASYTEAGQAP